MLTILSNFWPRRVLTFIPGSVLNDKDDPLTRYAIQSLSGNIAPELISDSLIFDLEDSVSQNFKYNAINSIGEFLEAHTNKTKIELVLRINARQGTELFDKELTLAAQQKFDSLIIPKVSLSTFMNIFESIRKFAKFVIPIIETTKGFQEIEHILNFVTSNSDLNNRGQNVPAIILGLDDLSSDLRIVRDSFFTEPALSSLLGKFSCSARSFNVLAIGPVYNKFKNHEGLIEETRRLKMIGFRGSLCVYPPYVRDIKKIFTPSKEEVEMAVEVLNKLQVASIEGRGWTFYKDTKYDLADKNYLEWVVKYSELCMKYERDLK